MGCEIALTGFDNHGRAVLHGDRVLRQVDADYREQALGIFDAYSRHMLADAGVVETWLAKDGDHLFEHRFHTLSFPHEWPAMLLKRAALFHLDLCRRLAVEGLTLKDALPNNIVFESAHPRFVDFLSLVGTDRLQEEEWLRNWSGGDPDLRRTVLREMFIPFFAIPLAAHAFGKPALARAMLRQQACRMTAEKPSARQLYDALPPSRRIRAWLFLRFCLKAIEQPFPRAWDELARAIEALPTADDTDYATYYASKGEDFPLDDRTLWRAKQLSVAKAIANDNPTTVLDIGANTGWFSRLAATLGATVTGLDVDESSLNALAKIAIDRDLAILPLHMPFGMLDKALGHDGLPTDGPAYFSAPVGRLTADTTMMLGLIHHLVLGEGRSLDAVFSTLARTCRTSAVVEFVSLDDPLVEGNREFFPAIAQWSREAYCVDTAIGAAMKSFTRVTTMPSHPDSRTILHLHK